MKKPAALLSHLLLIVSLVVVDRGYAEDSEPQVVELGGGRITLAVPADWEKTKPSNNIVEFEFSAAAADDDVIDARVTLMTSGGDASDAVRRWMGQFTQPDGVPTHQRTSLKDIKVAGQAVQLVDITGDFKDQPRGPAGPTLKREDFRMIAAVIETEKMGNYFLKIYGPRKTVAANEKAFHAVVNSLKVASP